MSYEESQRMYFQLKTIKREGHLDFKQSVAFPRIAEMVIDVADTSDVMVAGTITYAEPMILVEGVISMTVTYVCSRCLTEFDRGLKTQLSAAYSTDSEEAADDEILYVGGETVDISQKVEEAIFLSLDDRPICRPSCQGLCPECGINRNLETCTCEEKNIDPRLEALKDLLSDDNSE